MEELKEFRKKRSELFNALRENNALMLYSSIENNIFKYFLGKSLYDTPKKKGILTEIALEGKDIDKRSIYDLMDGRLLKSFNKYYDCMLKKINQQYYIVGLSKKYAKSNYEEIAYDVCQKLKEDFYDSLKKDNYKKATPHHYFELFRHKDLEKLKYKSNNKDEDIIINKISISDFGRQKNYTLTLQDNVGRVVFEDDKKRLCDVDNTIRSLGEDTNDIVQNLSISNFFLQNRTLKPVIIYQYKGKKEKVVPLLDKSELERMDNTESLIEEKIKEPRFIVHYANHFYNCYDHKNAVSNNEKISLDTMALYELTDFYVNAKTPREKVQRLNEIKQVINKINEKRITSYKEKRDLYLHIRQYEQKR